MTWNLKPNGNISDKLPLEQWMSSIIWPIAIYKSFQVGMNFVKIWTFHHRYFKQLSRIEETCKFTYAVSTRPSKHQNLEISNDGVQFTNDFATGHQIAEVNFSDRLQTGITNWDLLDLWVKKRSPSFSFWSIGYRESFPVTVMYISWPLYFVLFNHGASVGKSYIVCTVCIP